MKINKIPSLRAVCGVEYNKTNRARLLSTLISNTSINGRRIPFPPAREGRRLLQLLTGGFDVSRLLYLPGLLLLWEHGSGTGTDGSHAQLILDGALAHGYAKASLERIIIPAVIVGVHELLEPLQVLKVVLEPALDQLVHWNYLLETR